MLNHVILYVWSDILVIRLRIFFCQLHTSELNDGYDWGRLNLQSVTEQSSMDDFLATAELAGTEFIAGKRCLPLSVKMHSLALSQRLGNK